MEEEAVNVFVVAVTVFFWFCVVFVVMGVIVGMPVAAMGVRVAIGVRMGMVVRVIMNVVVGMIMIVGVAVIMVVTMAMSVIMTMRAFSAVVMMQIMEARKSNDVYHQSKHRNSQ